MHFRFKQTIFNIIKASEKISLLSHFLDKKKSIIASADFFSSIKNESSFKAGLHKNSVLSDWKERNNFSRCFVTDTSHVVTNYLGSNSFSHFF